MVYYSPFLTSLSLSIIVACTLELNSGFNPSFATC